eukprot:6191898-Pleurochrysis_carterae.AAC.1
MQRNAEIKSVAEASDVAAEDFEIDNASVGGAPALSHHAHANHTSPHVECPPTTPLSALGPAISPAKLFFVLVTAPSTLPSPLLALPSNACECARVSVCGQTWAHDCVHARSAIK